MGCGCSSPRNGVQKYVKEKEAFGESSKTKSFDTSFTDIGHVQTVLDNGKDKNRFIRALDNPNRSANPATVEKVNTISEFDQLDNNILSVVGNSFQTHPIKSDSNLVQKLSSRLSAVSVNPSQSFKYLQHQKDIVDAIPCITSQDDILDRYNKKRRTLSVLTESPPSP